MRPVIYHNPRCSKSRAALARLEARNVGFDVVEYLRSPPDVETLRALLDKLGAAPRDILRTGEPEYRQLGLDEPSLDTDALLQAVASQPKLLQRPIVVVGARAAIGRPAENIDRLFDD